MLGIVTCRWQKRLVGRECYGSVIGRLQNVRLVRLTVSVFYGNYHYALALNHLVRLKGLV